jgi:acyl-homoserine lactone acylase PvdQ
VAIEKRAKTAVLVAATLLLASGATVAVGSRGAGGAPGAPHVTDPAEGQTLSIVPPGNNGLVTVGQLVQFEANGTRPPNSQDQLGMYEDLPYHLNLTDSQLPSYYRTESLSPAPGSVASVEQPDSSVPVTITWDKNGVPYIDGQTVAAAAFGVGYAQAQARLFEMDVLRHYGAGDLSSFLGPSCADEEMDQSQLMSAPGTQAQLQAELNALPTEFPQDGIGAETLSLINNYVGGVNAYIAATRTNINLLPADYLAIGRLPTSWSATDVVSVASLIGGLLGSGGGNALQNVGLFDYLQQRYGSTAASQIFNAFKEQNDPAAPTTIVDKSFHYGTSPATLDPALNASPTTVSPKLTGIPAATTPGCDISTSSPTSLLSALLPYIETLPTQALNLILPAIPSLEEAITTLVNGLAHGLPFPPTDSNALVVTGAHTTSGHPIAVFGPQVAYWAPEILMQEVITAPGIATAGASFPGTGLVELGRGLDYAWSATSAGTQNIDTRIVQICNPNGGAAAAAGTDYLLNGACVPMTEETFTEDALPTPGGLGLPQVITHDIYFADGGIVQGWTTWNGKPAAISIVRSDYLHDIDSAVGFVGFDSYSVTNGVASWMQSAAKIAFTFNWFYVDDKDAGYFASGLDPVRPAGVDPDFPATDAAAAAWQGFLPASAHPQEVNPAQGFFVSWNNKPAPGFSASDSEFGYGPVYRSQMLVTDLEAQLAAHGGKVDRSQVVAAMASAATQDLTALTDWPALVRAVPKPASSEDAELLSILTKWVASGAHRIQAVPGQGQYIDASAVAISDELFPRLVVALFGRLFGGEGITRGTGGVATGFTSFPEMGFVNAPGSLGSAYDGGWEGYVQKLLDQVAGVKVAQPFPPAVLDAVCGPKGLADCRATIYSELTATWNSLVTANGGSTNPSTWTADSASAAAGESIPTMDEIQFTTVGVVSQPAIPWQNRSTFQQVAMFPESRSGS